MEAVKEPGMALEAARLQNLRSYEILDTPPDSSLDHITKMTARILGMPVAIVSLVDSDRIWFKSKYGIEAQEVAVDTGLCAEAILADKFYIVEDARRDIRTCENPLVMGKFGLQFYGAYPLKTREGFILGTLCVLDRKPRKFSPQQQEILKGFAELVISQLELRMEARTALKHHHNILNITAHDLKNPLSIMPLLADMILRNKENPTAIIDIASQMKSAGKRMNKIINDLLDAGREDTGRLQLRLQRVDFSVLLKGVVATNTSLARKKNLLLKLNIEKGCHVFADHQRLIEIADNLINNAIKYSPPGKKIYIRLKTEGTTAVLDVSDEGPGLTKDDLKNLFRKFTSLSARPTGGESSSGLGLSIVKHLVKAHRGNIHASSDGAGKGASFVVELPLSEKQ